MFKALAAIALCALLFLGKTISAQEEKQTAIQVGGSILAAQDILRKSRTEFQEGGLALTTRDEDVGFLLCIVDKHRTWVALFYSKSTKRITSIEAIFFPQQRHTRTQEIWTRAKSLTLGDDGSYSLQFLRAEPPKEQPKVEDQFPRAKYAPKQNSN